jgi:DNA-directed RNA polymerase alpha subunit
MRTLEQVEQENERLREELGVLYWKVKDIHMKLERFMEDDAQHRIRMAVAGAREKYKAVRVEGVPIDDLLLTVRTHNIVKSCNILTIEQLITHSRAELLKLGRMGRKSLNELVEVLASRGLKLRGEN